MKNESTYTAEAENALESKVTKAANLRIKAEKAKAAKYENPENVKAAYAFIFGTNED